MPIRFPARLAAPALLAVPPLLAVLAIGLVVAAPHALAAQAAGEVAQISRQDLRQWERDLQSDLIAEKFDVLDQTADQLRAEKTRVPGGQWQLRLFYVSLDAPQQTKQDSAEHIAHLEHWMSQRPNSITARVALATALTRWAWVARGNGFASTVTPEGWKLFNERIGQAQLVLEGSKNMPAKCPQWYSA
jgi:hypothetical protein